MIPGMKEKYICTISFIWVKRTRNSIMIVMILAFLDGLCTKSVIAMTMVGLMDASTPMN